MTLPSATQGEEGRDGREAGEEELILTGAHRRVEGVSGQRHRARESFSVELSGGFHRDLEGIQPPRASEYTRLELTQGALSYHILWGHLSPDPRPLPSPPEELLPASFLGQLLLILQVSFKYFIHQRFSFNYLV